MRICLAYIAVTNGPQTRDFSARFVGTYLQYPPGVEHETIVVCNGGPLDTETALIFASIPCTFFPRENDPGWDISAYMDVARRVECDMLCCMGESVYFHREGWLKRMADAWQERGPGMYGFFASHAVRAHLNTSAFCTSPKLLRAYPRKILTRADRYEFEHGERAFWRHCVISGRPTLFVTWDGIWLPTQWRSPRNILSRGDQSNLLVWCNHVDRYDAAPSETKKVWALHADRPFR